jgi:hypothetical protein
MARVVAAGRTPEGAALPCCLPRHAPAIERVIDACAAFIAERLAGDALVALVLTGSFARGEGSVLEVGDHLRVLGDLEFFVVSASAAHDRTLRPSLARWSSEATERFGRGAVRVDIEFGLLDLEYLRRRARPTIFLYDLLHHGRVVRGRDDVLTDVATVAAVDIPRDDALFLLFNRMIEQLDLYERLPELGGEALVDAAHQRQKLVLDLAGSALAFRGAHTSSYAARPAAFARLAAATPALARRLPPRFHRDLLVAARAKLDPAVVGPAERPPLAHGEDERRAWVRRGIVAAVPAVTAFLGWELEERLGMRAALPALLDRYGALSTWPERARAWAKVAVSPMAAPLPLSALRALALAWRCTPRAALYAAGALAYTDLPRGPAVRRDIARLLFLPRRARPRDASGQRRAIVALWRWCVRNG